MITTNERPRRPIREFCETLAAMSVGIVVMLPFIQSSWFFWLGMFGYVVLLAFITVGNSLLRDSLRTLYYRFFLPLHIVCFVAFFVYLASATRWGIEPDSTLERAVMVCFPGILLSSAALGWIRFFNARGS